MAHLYIKRAGVELGEMKHDSFIPAHHLAVSSLLSEDVAAIETDRSTAVSFLKKQTIQLSARKTGFAVLKYEGIPLGWMKVLNNRINNYYPIEWRILKD